jgi:hypothetical protein
VRFAFIIPFAVFLLACESAPAFPVPAGPPVPAAVDARFAHWTMGRYALDGFEGELRTQLAKYNIQVVPAAARPATVVRVNLGLLGYRQAIDVCVFQGAERRPGGRVRVPDLQEMTLDAGAELVANAVARAVYYAPERDPDGVPRDPFGVCADPTD